MKSNRKTFGEKLKYFLFGLIGIAAIVLIVWVVVTKLEGEAPVITIDYSDDYIARNTEIPVTVYDEKSEIRKVFVSMVQDGREITLANKTYGQDRPEDASPKNEVDFTLDLDIREEGLEDGDALLRIAAWDSSWRQTFSGNMAYTEKKVVIDSKPPRLSLLTRRHNLTQGGAGLVVYRLSEDCDTHGVRVGDHFFRGYSGYFDDADVYLAFFALRYDQGTNTDISLFAEDFAGNEGHSGLPHYIQNRVFESEDLRISDNFLRDVLPEFQSVEGLPVDKSPLEQFLYINKTLRRQNNDTLLSVYKDTDTDKHWEGSFGALPNAQRRAGFADHRTYLYNGEKINNAVHLGVDLASLSQAAVPAANSGRVAFVDWVGIYGNTVVIDHGFGLMSLYAHLSRAQVQPGDYVSKGDIIGNTGMTGLAGGDHLHFSMMVGDVFVNPYEWWDGVWIQNNISAKLENVAERINN